MMLCLQIHSSPVMSKVKVHLLVVILLASSSSAKLAVKHELWVATERRISWIRASSEGWLPPPLQTG